MSHTVKTDPPKHGTVADGYWPDGSAKPWRSVTVTAQCGRWAVVQYCDTGASDTVPAYSVRSGNACGDSEPNEHVLNTIEDQNA